MILLSCLKDFDKSHYWSLTENLIVVVKIVFTKWWKSNGPLQILEWLRKVLLVVEIDELTGLDSCYETRTNDDLLQNGHFFGVAF